MNSIIYILQYNCIDFEIINKQFLMIYIKSFNRLLLSLHSEGDIKDSSLSSNTVSMPRTLYHNLLYDLEVLKKNNIQIYE